MTPRPGRSETQTPEAPSDKGTPMMALYWKVKAENPDTFVLFRLGDFYEIFGEDAQEAARLLQITLTARSSGEGRVQKTPMCGVPHHAVDTYIQKLLKLGRKVAIVEQMEDPRKAKGMVKRELVRIITPGTILTPENLEAKKNNYLAALSADDQSIGLAAADLSTGEFQVTEFSGERKLEECLTELGRLRPAEMLVPDDLAPGVRTAFERMNLFLTSLEGFRFDAEAGKSHLIEHFKVSSLDGFGVGQFTHALGAAAATLHYLSKTQRGALAHIQGLKAYHVNTSLRLDEASIRNLELVQNTREATRQNTLLEVLDHTLTPMGGRKLYQWVLRPLLSLPDIHSRQAAVAELFASTQRRQALEAPLNRIYYLERLSGRIGAATASPRDLAALRTTLERVPELGKALALCTSERLKKLKANLPDLGDIQVLLGQALVDEPPALTKDGNYIRSGYNPEVDELRGLAKEGKSSLASIQARERERTGINSLKVEYNSVFGYYIEVSKANTKLVPPDYHRKQTLVNAERYITPELKEHEEKVLGAQDRLIELENELFLQLRSKVAERLSELLQAGQVIAELDALNSLSEAASKHNYCQPQVDDSGVIELSESRHPVVENLVPDKFVPNDAHLDLETNQLLVVTGPNMAGKSTYLRQVALIVIMAQMGGFVPAKSARIGVVDQVFTRVGASDNLAGGQSTFMVEMNETSNILNNATKNSLVILDEVGRGTSTFDGVSIAWAVAEHLHDAIGCKTLFATHYYELTELALSKERVKNYNIAVREWKDNIIFLRKIVEGSADRSYGIQVARLAGLPQPVLARAKEVLANLEKANYTDSGKSRLALHAEGERDSSPQISLFEPQLDPALVKELESLKPEEMTPLEALNKLVEWKGKWGKKP